MPGPSLSITDEPHPSQHSLASDESRAKSSLPDEAQSPPLGVECHIPAISTTIGFLVVCIFRIPKTRK